jgi:transcriptional regulator with GAF, ATPase, and Fis domain
MRDHERANIQAALQACVGKVFGPGGAAEMLDIKPTTLASRMKALGIAGARGRL